MVYGLDIVIPADASDTSLPWADDDDALLVPGSLALFDPSHSANPLVGVPVNGLQNLPNIAYKRLADLLGAGTASSLALSFIDPHLTADALIERTTKGGLHAIYSQTNNSNNNRGATIECPGPLRDYLFAHLDHDVYFSQWARRTRLNLSGGVVYSGSLSNAGSTSNYLSSLEPALAKPPTSGQGLGSRLAGATTAADLGNRYGSVGSAGWTGTTPSSSGSLWARLWGVGNWGAYGSSASNKCASEIIYRAYLEDLTVSGRTWAEVDAIDKALYDQAFAAGGRFYGDTFTDPATFP